MRSAIISLYPTPTWSGSRGRPGSEGPGPGWGPAGFGPGFGPGFATGLSRSAARSLARALARAFGMVIAPVIGPENEGWRGHTRATLASHSHASGCIPDTIAPSWRSRLGP